MACECGFGAVLHQEVEAGNGSRRRKGRVTTGGRERVFPRASHVRSRGGGSGRGGANTSIYWGRLKSEVRTGLRGRRITLCMPLQRCTGQAVH
jgi:hypothetical protein